MKRYLIYLLATAASVLFCAPNLMAQNNGNSESADDNITVVSAEGRSALVTNDGGKTWRWVRGNEGEEARQQAIESLRNAIQGAAPFALTASSPDPATGVVAIPLKTSLFGQAELRLYDNRGTQAGIQQMEVYPSQQSVQYATAALPNGVYSFSLNCGGVLAGVGRIVVAR